MKKNAEQILLDFRIKSDTILFFDLDGTLVDTDLANFLSYQKALQAESRSSNNLVFKPGERLNRTSLKVSIPDLEGFEYDRIVQAKEECYKDFLDEMILNTRVVEILFKYYLSNMTVLVTNSRKDRAMMTL